MPQLIRVLFARHEKVRYAARFAVVIGRPLHLDTGAFGLEHVLCRAPAKSAFRAPAKDGMHVGAQPARAAAVRRIPGAPGHVALVIDVAVSLVIGRILAVFVQGFEGHVAGDLGADRRRADAGVQAVGLFRDRHPGRGEDALQLGLVGGGRADGVDVNLLDVDAARVDALDELDGRVHGLRVEVVDADGLEHVGANVARGEGRRRPAARLVEVGAGMAQRLHEGCAHSGGEDLAVVKVVRLAEESVGVVDRQVEDAVDHGAKDGPAASLVDAEAAWDRRGRVRRVLGQERWRYGGEVRIGLADKERVAVDGRWDKDGSVAVHVGVVVWASHDEGFEFDTGTVLDVDILCNFLRIDLIGGH